MNIFIQSEELVIRRIETNSDGWLLYPQKEEKPRQISRKYYQGKMPPVFKWPWQTSKLKITSVDGFILSAVLDDVELFKLKEQDYPPQIKKSLAKGEKLWKRFEASQKRVHNEINEALKAYLPSVPLDPELEDKISTLNICLRVYLKANFLLGGYSPEDRQRLNLMFLLIGIVQRVYERHINAEEWLATTLARIVFNDPYPHYTIKAAEIEAACKQEETKLVLRLYYEIERLFSERLPSLEDGLLRRYLNYVVQELLSLFADDYAELQLNLCKDFHGRRTFSDEEEYRMQYQKMNLPGYACMVLPQIVPAPEFAKFVREYSLR